MGEPSKEINSAMAVLSGSLVAGNHDSITLFGAHAQSDLKDCSRKISSLLLKGEKDLDAAIADIVAEAERLESETKKPARFFLGRNGSRRGNRGDREKISAYIENVTLQLKLQQVQLSKEIKLLERLEETLLSCLEELESCIDEGEAVLGGKRAHNAAAAHLPSASDDDFVDEVWYARLERRVGDLAVSRAVAQQSRAQVNLLRESNLLMFDRVSSVISSLSTMCQNQATIEQGLNLVEGRIELQETVLEAVERHVSETS